jgi:regulator of sigma D
MLVKQDSGVTERRAQSQNLIHELILVRTEMLALYSKLAANKPYDSDDSVSDLVQEFCEILVDYTAAAHFQLYRFIEEKQEKRKRVLQLAEQIYPQIVETTRIIVEFNDRYENIQDIHIQTTLEDDLSRLGEALAERIELEDQLIEVLSVSRSERSEESRH